MALFVGCVQWILSMMTKESSETFDQSNDVTDMAGNRLTLVKYESGRGEKE